MTSGIRMRTQPWEAAWPIVPYSLGSMPWMPAPSKMPSQRALSGFSGEPPGTTLPRSAGATQEEFGMVHAGFTALFWMWYRPAGAGVEERPHDRPAQLAGLHGDARVRGRGRDAAVREVHGGVLGGLVGLLSHPLDEALDRPAVEGDVGGDVAVDGPAPQLAPG